MPEVKELLGVVAGLLGVVVAWLTYKTKKHESAELKNLQRSVVLVSESGVPSSKWSKWKFLTRITTVCIALAAAYGLYFSNIGMALALLLAGLLGMSIALLAHVLLPRRDVSFLADVVVALESAQALELALDGVRSLQADIAQYDATNLTLVGYLPWRRSMFFGPHLISVRIVSIADRLSSITVKSDTMNPFASFGKLANKHRVQQVVNCLLAR